MEEPQNKGKDIVILGGKIDDITKALEDITEKEKHDSLYIVHVGTNDVKNTNSEELLEKYKRLIGTLKEK